MGNRELRILAVPWRFFSSLRLALFLILILTVLALIGALLIQMPAEVSGNAEFREMWLQQIAQPKFGVWAASLNFLGLFNVFHSLWFIGAGILLIANILVCNINRWKSLKYSGRTNRQSDAFYAGGTHTDDFDVPEDAVSINIKLAGIFKRHRYKVYVRDEAGRSYITADKNLIFRWGTYFTHLSLILFITGFLLSNTLGFRDEEFIVVEGTTAQVGHDTGLSLKLDSFADEYWPDGTPMDYRSDVVIYHDGIETEKGVVRVNHPISCNGIRFYQSFFGPAVVMNVADRNSLIFDGGVALAKPLNNDNLLRYGGGFVLPQYDLIVAIISPAANTEDPFIPPGSYGLIVYNNSSGEERFSGLLEIGKAAQIDGINYQVVNKAEYSGFQVTYDPGRSLIWVASGLFLAGLATTLYLPYRRAWVLIKQELPGSSAVRMRLAGPRNTVLANELNDLKAEVDRSVRKERH